MTGAGGQRSLAIRSEQPAMVRADGLRNPFGRRALRMSAAVTTAALVFLAVGASVGRWRVLPASAQSEGVSVERNSAVMVVPIAPQEIRDGDTVVFGTPGEDAELHHVDYVADSWNSWFAISDGDGEPTRMQIHGNVWRVSREVPYAGLPYRMLIGPVQAILLVLNGILLVAFARSRRDRPAPPAPHIRRRDQGRSGRPQLKVVAAAVAVLALGALGSGLSF